MARENARSGLSPDYRRASGKVDWNVALIIATSLLEIEPEQTLYDLISFRGFALHKSLAPTSNMRR
jgi:hypothetical protein